MKICIYGAGAIGGYMGVQLALSGQDVSLIARGPHLKAIKRHGLKLLIEGEERVAQPNCTDDPSNLSIQDVVIVGVKAHSVPAIIDSMKPLIGPDTIILSAVNGVPWWYFYKLGNQFDNLHLESIDPGRRQWNEFGPEKAIGCVVYPACDVPEPGVIRHIEGNRFSLGEPTGETTERVTRLSEVLKQSGLEAPVRNNIRDEVWLKLWGNLCFNPISALTHATLDVIATQAGTRDIAARMMQEAQSVAEKLGASFRVDLERRIKGAARVGPHKTSMLQDLEQGRPMEIDALTASVCEVAALVGVPTPTIDIILALTQQRAAVAGLYSAEYQTVVSDEIAA